MCRSWCLWYWGKIYSLFKFPFRSIIDRDWRTTDMYIWELVYLFLACLLMLATIQLNYWTRLADNTLWDLLSKFFRSWIQCTWAGSNLLFYQPFKIILSLKTITWWHRRWQLFSPVAWREITKATFVVQMVLIAIALTS